jgi:hypothetical protein
MRRRISMIIALAGLALCSCEDRNTHSTESTSRQQQSSEKSTSVPRASPVTSLDAEATAQVKQHFESLWGQRGDSWFVTNRNILAGTHLKQAKGIRFIVHSNRPPSEADRLNGIDWSGTATVYAKLVREKDLDIRSATWGTGKMKQGCAIFLSWRKETDDGQLCSMPSLSSSVPQLSNSHNLSVLLEGPKSL